MKYKNIFEIKMAKRKRLAELRRIESDLRPLLKQRRLVMKEIAHLNFLLQNYVNAERI